MIRAATLVLTLAACFAIPAQGQVRFRDLVATMGASAESYRGNFSAVANPIVDSTRHAVTAVGEVGLRGTLSFVRNSARSVEVSFDGGMRQAAAFGFKAQDYSPREWVGVLSARYTESLGTWGSVLLRGGYRGRSLEDRPPMPLFLQPGYVTLQGGVGLVTRAFDGVSFWLAD